MSLIIISALPGMSQPASGRPISSVCNWCAHEATHLVERDLPLSGVRAADKCCAHHAREWLGLNEVEAMQSLQQSHRGIASVRRNEDGILICFPCQVNACQWSVSNA